LPAAADRARPPIVELASAHVAEAPAGAVAQATLPTRAPAVDPEAVFRDAVDIALEDSRAAVVGYSRAALMGHERAAYYLGQIYETGDGVPVDLAIARHWYEAASLGNPRAQRRLAALPGPEAG
jgi:TPR repeat protein